MNRVTDSRRTSNGIFSRCSRIPRRGILGALMFLAGMFCFVMQTNISIAIVAMSKPTGKSEGVSYCKGLNMTVNQTKKIHDYGEQFDWSPKTQGLVLSAYYYGVLPSGLPAGRLAEKFGGVRVIAYATLIPALLNIAMPWAANLHYSVVIALRFIMGFFGAAVYPAMSAMIARWVPPSEKGMFVWTLQGGTFGAFVTLSLCGLLIGSFNWHYAFYVTSALTLVFYALWMFLAYDTPDVHPTITEEEKAYIKEKIGMTVSKKQAKLPLLTVATSPPFLVQLWAHFANMWGVNFTATNGPKYTLQVLGLEMTSGGFFTGLPYVARLGCGAIFAAAGDYLRRNKILRVVWIRKLFMLSSHVGPGVALIMMSYAGCNSNIALFMFILAFAFNGATCQTSMQNHQDLAPNYAGSLSGIMSTIGCFPGFIIPPTIAYLTDEVNGVEQWRGVFWLSAVVFFSATVLFWVFGSADIQPWNDYTQASGTNVPDKTDEINNLAVKESQEDDPENVRR